MKWTTSRPTEAGLWCWTEYEHIEVFEITDRDGRLFVAGSDEFPVDQMTGSWLGPLPERPLAMHAVCPNCKHDWSFEYPAEYQAAHMELKRDKSVSRKLAIQDQRSASKAVPVIDDDADC